MRQSCRSNVLRSLTSTPSWGRGDTAPTRPVTPIPVRGTSRPRPKYRLLADPGARGILTPGYGVW